MELKNIGIKMNECTAHTGPCPESFLSVPNCKNNLLNPPIYTPIPF